MILFMTNTVGENWGEWHVLKDRSRTTLYAVCNHRPRRRRTHIDIRGETFGPTCEKCIAGIHQALLEIHGIL